ncbi:MAG: 4-hydroxyphenylacetate 3-hydroxylase N-terminal domain-containing protein [Ilumatobacteraceae bacterium]
MIRTGQQYLDSLRDGRRVYCGGELITDVTTHPKTKGFAATIAHYYDLHHEVEHQDLLTFVDEDGVRRAMHWMLPTSKEQVVQRRRYYEFWWRTFKGAIFTRPPASMNCVMFAQVDDPEPWETNSTLHDGQPLAQNIRDQWNRLKTADLSISPMFLDVQYDRSREDAMAETPMLHMVRRDDEGIVVRGWKAIGTGMAFANELLIGNLWRPGQTPEQTVYALVPVASEGLSIFCRPSNAAPDADPFDRPLAHIGDELDGMAYFDDVRIPWERVQHVGNPRHAQLYPQRQFDWVHVETQIRHATNAELMVGLALLITHALGTNTAPTVQSNLADLIRFRETCRAFAIAAEETGFTTPGGMYKPNNIFVDFGRAYYLENIAHMTDILIDFCGRGVVVYPTAADFDDPYIGPKLHEVFRGAGISAIDRTKIFKLVHERFLTEWGTRKDMFEKFNGTPLYLIKLLTMQRTEYQIDGPMTQLARDVLELGSLDEIATRAAESERTSNYAPVRYQPAYAQAQDQADGYRSPSLATAGE